FILLLAPCSTFFPYTTLFRSRLEERNVFSIRTSFSISKCSRSINPSEVKPTIAILTPSISLIVYGVEKYGSFVRLYSIFADSHGNLDNDTALEKNDKPNLNSFGLIPLASYCMAFINLIMG